MVKKHQEKKKENKLIVYMVQSNIKIVIFIVAICMFGSNFLLFQIICNLMSIVFSS